MCVNILSIPHGSILLSPSHSFGGSFNDGSASLDCCFHWDLALLWSIKALLLPPSFLIVQQETSPSRFSLGIIQLTLDAREVIVVVIDSFWRGKVTPLDIYRRITDAVALRPLLVTLGAGKRAGADKTARAAIFVRMNVAFKESASGTRIKDKVSH